MRRRPAPPAAPVLDVRQLDAGLPLPAYAHPGDAGLDLHAADSTTLLPGARALIPCGIAVGIPAGYVGLVHPRSGLAVDEGVTVLNAPGTIDSGYRGEIKVLLVNHGQGPVEIRHGERIAQLVVAPVAAVDVRLVDRLGPSERGTGGFGSTGR